MLIPSFGLYVEFEAVEESLSPPYRVPENKMVTVDVLVVIVNSDTLVVFVKFRLYVMCFASFLLWK